MSGCSSERVGSESEEVSDPIGCEDGTGGRAEERGAASLRRGRWQLSPRRCAQCTNTNESPLSGESLGLAVSSLHKGHLVGVQISPSGAATAAVTAAAALSAVPAG